MDMDDRHEKDKKKNERRDGKMLENWRSKTLMQIKRWFNWRNIRERINQLQTILLNKQDTKMITAERYDLSPYSWNQIKFDCSREMTCR